MDDLDILIKTLPDEINLSIYHHSGRIEKSKKYDLVIFGYRNTVGYWVLKNQKNTGKIILDEKLMEFYDGELIDNVKKMFEFLVEGKFI